MTTTDRNRIGRLMASANGVQLVPLSPAESGLVPPARTALLPGKKAGIQWIATSGRRKTIAKYINICSKLYGGISNITEI
jgi:hypothetical protein